MLYHLSTRLKVVATVTNTFKTTGNRTPSSQYKVIPMPACLRVCGRVPTCLHLFVCMCVYALVPKQLYQTDVCVAFRRGTSKVLYDYIKCLHRLPACLSAHLSVCLPTC